jgi:hypothetical protein
MKVFSAKYLCKVGSQANTFLAKLHDFKHTAFIFNSLIFLHKQANIMRINYLDGEKGIFAELVSNSLKLIARKLTKSANFADLIYQCFVSEKSSARIAIFFYPNL